MRALKKKAVAKVKQELRRLSKDFSLNYKINTPVIFISKREYILRRYISGCPDSSYNQFGLGINKRIKHIDAFLNSDVFREEMKEPGGVVMTKQELEREAALSETIADEKIRKEMINYYKKFNRKDKERFICLTEPESKKELNFIMSTVLKHEWIHVLLQNNDLFFQNIKQAYWPYDEGLAVYLQGFSDRKINFLQQKSSRIRMDRKILTKTRQFIKLFKDKKTPEQRRDALSNFYMDMEDKAQ